VHTGNQAMLQLQSTYPENRKDVKLCDIPSSCQIHYSKITAQLIPATKTLIKPTEKYHLSSQPVTLQYLISKIQLQQQQG